MIKVVLLGVVAPLAFYAGACLATLWWLCASADGKGSRK